MGRTFLIFHKINIGEIQLDRQGLRHIPPEHIPVLKNEVEKLHKMGAIKPKYFYSLALQYSLKLKTEQCAFVLIIVSKT